MPKESKNGQLPTVTACPYNGPPITAELEADKPRPDRRTRTRVNAKLVKLAESKKLESAKPISTPLRASEIRTLYHLLVHAKTHDTERAIGTRKELGMEIEVPKVTKLIDGKPTKVDGSAIKRYKMSDYTYISYPEFHDLALHIGSGLRAYEMKPGDRIVMFASTSCHWLATAHGAFSQSIGIVTAYDSLGPPALGHSLTQTEAKGLYCDSDLLPSLIMALRSQEQRWDDECRAKDIDEPFNRKLKFVFHNPIRRANPEHVFTLEQDFGVKVYPFDSLVDRGRAEPVPVQEPEPDHVACIMYTSGSTADPKGVILTHANLTAAVAGADFNVGEYLNKKDVLMAYLPLAHVLEFVFENCALLWGARIGYGSPNTLSDRFMVKGCESDLVALKPTILVGVPKIWENIYKGAEAKVAKVPAWQGKLFWAAVEAKKMLAEWGLPFPAMLERKFFSQIKDLTGGQLRITFNGGGRVADRHLRFISTAIVPMVSGYGLTETCAMCTIMDPLKWVPRGLGELTGCVEVMLADYATEEHDPANPNGPAVVSEHEFNTKKNPPQGEICIRGPSVTSGYFKNAAETQKAFYPGGWFRTGDAGEFDKSGNLSIVGRFKNLVKMSTGEYVSIEKIESDYATASVVSSIVIYLKPEFQSAIAIVVPKPDAMRIVIEKYHLDLDSKLGAHVLCHEPKFVDAFLKEMLSIDAVKGLNRYERLCGLVLDPVEWNPADGTLTAAQKLNRENIKRANQEAYDKMEQKALGKK